MAKTMLLVCGSFEKGSCRKRLDYYVEREATHDRLVIEKVPCIFYIKGDCGLKEAHDISHYIYGYPQPKTFELKNGRLEEIARPSEIILSPRPV